VAAHSAGAGYRVTNLSMCNSFLQLPYTTDAEVLLSPQPDQEGNGSPGTCNPEKTGLPGLQMSCSPTLFSGSGPIGLPPVPWTEKTNGREVGRVKDLLAPLQNGFELHPDDRATNSKR
jgi:hypothetical protein